GEQGGAHGGVGQAVDHAAVQHAVGVEVLGLDGQLEPRPPGDHGLRAHAQQLGKRPADRHRRLLEVRVDADVDQVRATARQRPADGGTDLGRLLDALAGHAERAGELDVVHQRLVDVHADVL